MKVLIPTSWPREAKRAGHDLHDRGQPSPARDAQGPTMQIFMAACGFIGGDAPFQKIDESLDAQVVAARRQQGRTCGVGHDMVGLGVDVETRAGDVEEVDAADLFERRTRLRWSPNPLHSRSLSSYQRHDDVVIAQNLLHTLVGEYLLLHFAAVDAAVPVTSTKRRSYRGTSGRQRLVPFREITRDAVRHRERNRRT